MKYMQKCPRNRTSNQRKLKFWEKMGSIPNYSTEKLITQFCPGDLVTCTGDWEIVVVSGRLPDNPGKLACILFIR